jgi:exosortase C (VPDSG-CTERM-specific)
MVIGLAILAAYFWTRHAALKLQTQDYLAFTTASFLCLFVAACFLARPSPALVTATFPLALLIFMIPFPIFLEHALASFLQHGSADAAFWFLTASGMPVFRTGTLFQLPGFSMEVAPQCSGIHSSLVLFIASLLAAHLLLNRRWTGTLFILAVVPLGILRNGLRIFILAQLCVRVSPDWINSELHRRGGPVFFVVSLVPFFVLLLWLRKWEVKKLKSRTVG